MPRIPSCASLLSMALMALSSTSLYAQESVIRKVLVERFSNLPSIESVTATPVDGLYEVRLNKNQIVYVDAKANFLLDGQLINTATKENITGRRIGEFSAIPWSEFPLKDAILVKRGSGNRKLAVFIDPHCGHCKQLEQELKLINNVTLHIFLLPVLGHESKKSATSIWCSKDRAAAYTEFMKTGKGLTVESCDASAIDRTLAFAEKMKIVGTPAVFLADGTLLPGNITAKALEEKLAKTAATKL